MQDVVRELESKQHIYVGTPEAEYLHWQFESCGNSVHIGETMNITFDESFVLRSTWFKGRIRRDGKDIIVIPSGTHMPSAREEFIEVPPGSKNLVVDVPNSWYPNPMPNYGETWMTKVLSYWAHPDTKEEHVMVQIVKKLNERSL